MLLHLLNVPNLVPRQAEAPEELEGEGNPEAAKVTIVADEVLDVPDILKHFVSKYEYLVAAEVQLLEVVELVKDPGGELAEVVVGEVELLQVGQVVKGGRGDGADVVPVEHQLLQRFEPVEVVIDNVGDVVGGEVQATKGGKAPQSSLPNVRHLIFCGKMRGLTYTKTSVYLTNPRIGNGEGGEFS